MLGLKELESISVSLDNLDKLLHKPTVDHKTLVDFNARLNAILNKAESLRKELSQVTKDYMISNGIDLLTGHKYQANITEIQVTRLLTDKIKTYLGKHLSKFSNTTTEYRITYTIKQ